LSGIAAIVPPFAKAMTCTTYLDGAVMNALTYKRDPSGLTARLVGLFAVGMVAMTDRDAVSTTETLLLQKL
jgi:hypothetical protein